jgi:hypothetical protein
MQGVARRAARCFGRRAVPSGALPTSPMRPDGRCRWPTRSWRRCGAVLAQMWRQSVPAQFRQSRCSPGAVPVQSRAAGCICSDAGRARAQAMQRWPSFMCRSRHSACRSPLRRRAHASSLSRARRRRPRRSAASARCTTPSQPMPLTATTRISHGSPLPPPLPAGKHRMCRMRPTRRASLSAEPSRRTLSPA